MVVSSLVLERGGAGGEEKKFVGTEVVVSAV
jgi:hypothetical protein